MKEKRVAKDEGIRLHPNSGSGHIKFDGSDDDRVVEIKDAVRSFTLNANYLMGLFKNAARESKEAVLIIDFPEIRVTATITRKARK